MRLIHYIENPLNVFDRNVLVKQVAHRIYEDRLRFFPSKGQSQHMRLERKFETISIILLTHCLQPFRHSLRIAVLTAGADLGTASDGVPRGIGPLYCGFIGHFLDL